MRYLGQWKTRVVRRRNYLWKFSEYVPHEHEISVKNLYIKGQFFTSHTLNILQTIAKLAILFGMVIKPAIEISLLYFTSDRALSLMDYFASVDLAISIVGYVLHIGTATHKNLCHPRTCRYVFRSMSVDVGLAITPYWSTYSVCAARKRLRPKYDKCTLATVYNMSS